jgi:hypothetical protein
MSGSIYRGHLPTADKIAVLVREESLITPAELGRLQIALDRLGVIMRTFEKSEDAITFEPSLVLSFSLQDAKLTKYPTYGVLCGPVEQLAKRPRFVRNLLSYDACFATHPAILRFVKDIRFGARKLDYPCGFFGITAPLTPFHFANPAKKQMVVNTGAIRYPSSDELITRLLAQKLLRVVDFGAHGGTLDAIADQHDALLDCYRDGGVALILPNPSGAQEIGSELFAAISAGVSIIAPHNAVVAERFGNNIWWYDGTLPPARLSQAIRKNFHEIIEDHDRAVKRALAAHEIFAREFALEVLLPNLFDLHHHVLEAKGYVPSRDEEVERTLPSVSYIIRTGNRDKALFKRTLDSLVAQRYPKLVVILVLWSRMPYLEEILAEYSMLTFKIVEDFGKRRSTGICTGMRNVETELFGLLDDDDELHPNHIRSMVKALRYHNRRDWRGDIGLVYSASIEVDNDFPRFEKIEWRDDSYRDRSEHRAIEHFRFYTSTQMASHRWYLMSFLARTSLIDEEILDDPEMDTCEDLCLLLQIAQKTHFAFSGEVTAVHWYHQGSSTRIDALQHASDTRRISDRNHGRYFPSDIKYVSEHSRFWDPNYPSGYVRGRGDIPETPFDAVVIQPKLGKAIRSPAFVETSGVQARIRLLSVLTAWHHYHRFTPDERRRLRNAFWQYFHFRGWRIAIARVGDFARARSELSSLRRPVAESHTPKRVPYLMRAWRHYRRVTPVERHYLRVTFQQHFRQYGLRAAITRTVVFGRNRSKGW